MATPAGFANHGAFVSCVAHMKDVTLATVDWTTITPESCAAADAARKPAKGQAGTSHGNGKGAEKRAQHAQGG
jgi:hypothetical protein